MTATVLFGLALGVGAPALKEKEKPASLVGEWEITECVVGGNPSAANTNRWVFLADGSRVIIGSEGKTLVSGQYTADPKTGAMDLDPGRPVESTYLCLYKLDRDTLTLNVGWQKAPRPTAFESPAGSQCTLYVMKRVKKE